jgi:hypothetical protein
MYPGDVLTVTQEEAEAVPTLDSIRTATNSVVLDVLKVRTMASPCDEPASAT